MGRGIFIWIACSAENIGCFLCFPCTKNFRFEFSEILVSIVGRHVVSFFPRLLDPAYRMCSNSPTGSFWKEHDFRKDRNFHFSGTLKRLSQIFENLLRKRFRSIRFPPEIFENFVERKAPYGSLNKLNFSRRTRLGRIMAWLIKCR